MKKSAKNSIKNTGPTPEPVSAASVNLGALLSTKPIFQPFNLWLIGDTPLITHAWSEKAKREMLQKQVKATKPGKEARDPQEDFVSSLYPMGIDHRTKKPFYGFPVTAIKNAILSSAHKDKGVARSVVQSALFLDADMVRVQPALAGAICDLPLVRVFGDEPEMREDMVRVGVGLNKTATLAYRGQFTNWAMRISGRFNPAVLSAEALSFLILEAGIGVGIGEWRNEKKGIFGAFRPASMAEATAWDKFTQGKGPIPARRDVELQAAAE